MNKDSFVKFCARIGVCLAAIGFPFVLIVSLIWKAISILFTQSTDKKIAGDVAVITGAGHGLGRCIALQLAAKGCHIAVVDINLEGAATTVDMIQEKYNVKAKAYKTDVSNYDEVLLLNQQITEDLGIATILVNNAGILLLKDFLKLEPQEIQKMIDVNLTSHFWTNQVFLRNMRSKKKGHIIAISSLAGMLPVAYHSQYTSTKYAVRGLMRALRLELKANRLMLGEEIYATTVFPSFLKTNERVVKVIKQSGLDLLYPLITGEEGARRIISGMLRNEEEIIFPGGFTLLYRLYECLPNAVQDLLLFGQGYLVPKQYDKLYA